MIRGRGVYYLDGDTRCPLAGIGARGPFASIRLALDDDDSEAELDRAARRLVVRNRRSYARPTLIGDLIVLGRGRTRTGRTVPIALHTRFDKTGVAVRARPHLHPTVAGPLVDVELEPLSVLVNDAVVLTPELGRRVATRPPLADWIGRALITIRPNPRAPGAIADLTVGLGVGRLAVPMVRAALSGPGAPRSLAELLGAGDWCLRFTVLGRFRDLQEHLGRAVFLLGLDGVPLLRRVRDGELRRGETLTVRMRDGAGSLELGGERAAVPDVAGVARAFLEYDLLGSVLAQAVAGGDAGRAAEAGQIVV